MLETELKELIEKIKKRKTEFQTVELKSTNKVEYDQNHDQMIYFS